MKQRPPNYTQKTTASFEKWVESMDEDHTNWLDLDHDVDLLKKAVKADIAKLGDHEEVSRARLLVHIIFGL